VFKKKRKNLAQGPKTKKKRPTYGQYRRRREGARQTTTRTGKPNEKKKTLALSLKGEAERKTLAEKSTLKAEGCDLPSGQNRGRRRLKTVEEGKSSEKRGEGCAERTGDPRER